MNGVGALVWLAIVGATVAGWFTHLFVCFTAGKWGFLVAGAIFAPIGVIHGWGSWFGWW